MRREDEHLDARAFGQDLLRGLKAVEERHGDVHHDDIGMERPCHGHGLAPVVGLPDHLDLLVRKKEGAKALTHNGVVVS